MSKPLNETHGESRKVSQFKHTTGAATCRCQQVAYITSFLDLMHKDQRFTTDDVILAVQAKVHNLLSSSSEGVGEMIAVESSQNDAVSVLTVRFVEDYNMKGTDNS